MRATARHSALFDTNLAEEMSLCFDDPLRYALIAFKWGEGELAGAYPDQWQIDTLNAIRDSLRSDPNKAVQLATASGHGIGKSALTAWLILWAMSTRPNLSAVVTANTGAQLSSKTWRELALWHARAVNKAWFTWTATRFYHNLYPQTWVTTAVPNTEHNSEAFAGLHSQFVMQLYDEASAIPDRIWEVSEGAMTTPGAIWCVFGNPTRNTGRFRECFGRYAHRWTHRQVDSRTAAMTDKAKLQEWVEDYGEDSDFVRVRIRGEFPRAGDTQFIPSNIVQRALEREMGPEIWATYPLIIGVDVARFGMDQSVIIRRQGPKVWEPLKFRGLDTMSLAGHVVDEIRRFRPVAVYVDGCGVGGGVVDRLKQEHFPNTRIVDVQFGAQASDSRLYSNVRAECWARMREWLNGDCDIAKDSSLADGLMQPEYGFNSRMQLQLERKEDMKSRGLASPDEADALACTFAVVAAEQYFGGTARPVTQSSNRLYV